MPDGRIKAGSRDRSSVLPPAAAHDLRAPAFQRLFALLTDGSSEQIAVLSEDGRYRMVGGSPEALFGWSREELLGQTFLDGVIKEDRARVQHALAAVEPGASVVIEHRRTRRGGGHADVRTVLVNRRDDPQVRGLVATTREGAPPGELPDRAAFLGAIREAMGAPGLRPAVVVLDLANFRFVVAGLGHERSERLILAVARRIRRTLGMTEGSVIARIAPQELALLVEDVPDEAALEEIIALLKDRLRAPFHVSGQDVVVQPQIGLAVRNPDQEDASSFLAEAEASSLGSTGTSGAPKRFRDTMRTQEQRRVRLAAALPRCVQRNELQVRYHPIVALDRGMIVGFEALVRWMHPELGLVSPGEFIPLAEDLDWIGQLDDWMIEEACRQVASWHTATPVKLSVNVSARHLGELNLVAGVSKALSASGLPPAALRLEVTETAIYDNPEAAKETLGRIRGLGVSIAMDDFGTGYASFGSVAEMPLDALKIDRSFVARLPHDRQGVRVVEGVIGMATQLGLDVVAEGVESADQLEVLRTLCCGFAQGHYFAHPLTAADARKLLAEATRW